MSDMRPELSKRSKYYIDRLRYYELKYFCLQYPEWKKRQAEIDGYVNNRIDIFRSGTAEYTDQTYSQVQMRSYYSDNIKLLEDAAQLTDPILRDYILKGVTEGLSYSILQARYMIPCCRDIYYDRYRKFFWILNVLKHKHAGDDDRCYIDI